MKKHLVRQKDIELLTGRVGLEAVVLIEDRNGKQEIFVDLVLPSQNEYWRVCKREGGKERIFKSVNTAVNLLMDEGFPTIQIKTDRDFLASENLHTKDEDQK